MDLLDQLAQTRSDTLTFFDLSTAQLDLRYAPGKWSIRLLLHHLADAETVLFDRIRRVLSSENPVIWAFDQDAWSVGLDYANRPLSLSRSLYTTTREGIIYYADLFYASHGDRTFVHSETGLRTLQQEFDKVAWHNAHHLSQICQALAQAQPS